MKVVDWQQMRIYIYFAEKAIRGVLFSPENCIFGKYLYPPLEKGLPEVTLQDDEILAAGTP